jgi:O-antigen/teichoic acid export membrane protein
MLVGVLYFGWQLTHLVMLLVTLRGLALIANYWLCTRIFSTLKGLPHFHLAELKKLLAFGGWITVSSLVVPLLLYMDRFVIGATLTMTAVAYYSVPYDVVTRLWIIPLSVITALYPAFSTLRGQGRGEQLAPLLAQSMKWVLLTLGPIVVLIAAFASDILRLWLGSDFARESTIAFQILVVAILVNSMVQVPYTLVQALGRPDLTAKFHLIQLPFHGLLVWLFISRWGVMGAAMAQAIRIALEALLLLVASCRLVSLPFRSFVYDRTVQTLLLIFLFTGLSIGVSNLSMVMWLRLLALGIIILAMAGTVWRYSLNRQDRGELAKLFGS